MQKKRTAHIARFRQDSFRSRPAKVSLHPILQTALQTEVSSRSGNQVTSELGIGHRTICAALVGKPITRKMYDVIVDWFNTRTFGK